MKTEIKKYYRHSWFHYWMKLRQALDNSALWDPKSMIFLPRSFNFTKVPKHFHLNFIRQPGNMANLSHQLSHDSQITDIFYFE
ncbi:hypothetical protein NQ318_017786 [Aromia moschata]|uniref:Uncharacterized protein n=1 Tax=Aromia moschata TaxID=1265417 RepID=A0AAV8XVC4_9CUCU|nr:hypothetical protein NQ318_017786 [Aromia moschata]